MSEKRLFDVVILSTGVAIATGLIESEAKAIARDWNSRASLNTWVALEPSKTGKAVPTC